jgi:hypothetical protein
MDYGYMNDLVPVNSHFLGHKEVARRSQTEAGKRAYSLSFQETQIQDIQYRDSGDKEVHQAPMEFGRPSHPEKDGGYQKGKDGLYRFRFSRGTDRGYGRTNAVEFECAKFNQRLNPRFNRVGNVMVGDMEYRRKEEDMVAATLAHFPRVGGLITSVRLLFSLLHKQV